MSAKWQLDTEKDSDPLPRFRERLISAGILDERSNQALSEAVNQEVETAIKEADAAPFPNPDSAFTGVYAP